LGLLWSIWIDYSLTGRNGNLIKIIAGPVASLYFNDFKVLFGPGALLFSPFCKRVGWLDPHGAGYKVGEFWLCVDASETQFEIFDQTKQQKNAAGFVSLPR
jgi:hypothetical protein